MKLTKVYVRPTLGQLIVLGYIRANWFERRALRRRQSDRPNLREMPTYWPAAVEHKANFAIRRKGAKIGMPKFGKGVGRLTRFLLKPEFNYLDMIGMTVTGAIVLAGYHLAAMLLGLVCIAVSTVARHRLKEVL